MPSQPLPHASALSDIYTPEALLNEGARWNALFEAFKNEYGVPVQKVSRAPGRVNIIGEHIDYCGFSVLPAAVEKDVLIAFSTADSSSADLPSPSAPNKTVFVLRNVESKYSPASFEINLAGAGDDLELPAEHHWSSYFIAGTKGILAHLAKNKPKWLPQMPERVLVLVHGTVPEGSGLSSSSAMTTASAIAVLEIVGRREGGDMVCRRDVTNVAIESERLVGVNSGGMDQSASVFSRSKHLLHIEFIPQLEARAIPLPTTEPPFSFVIANTLVTSNKKVTAKYHYNLRVSRRPDRVSFSVRIALVPAGAEPEVATVGTLTHAYSRPHFQVVECRLGALLLSKHLNLPFKPTSRPFPSYKMILSAYFNTPPPPPGPAPKGRHPPTHLPPTLPTVPALPSSRLPPNQETKSHELKIFMGLVLQALGGPGLEEGMTWEEVAERLEIPAEELKSNVADREVEPKDGKFKIWLRARHVFSEALRVYEFKKLLEDTAATASRVPTPTGEDSLVLETTAQPPADCTDYDGADLKQCPSDPYTTSSLAVPEGSKVVQSDEIFDKLGGLMDESMVSCRNDFDCSCPELDELVAIAKKAGAKGSRVTGPFFSFPSLEGERQTDALRAGWGGATVSLVLEPDLERFIAALRSEYYAKRFPNLTGKELADACFATKPEAGACLFENEEAKTEG
ncbi:SPOSA6832_04764 [Sporobolomyces salmonicolor]|uniref:SPOSA6832_04764-mRNA-1:cds n=1 Tax=Sporidiobolus salmonicolor TaxID=5005 RepID=A0A0D6ETH5_SPOSA|nr:SPOSA6832_04764 [Sporobolomyces salmonicolor]